MVFIFEDYIFKNKRKTQITDLEGKEEKIFNFLGKFAANPKRICILFAEISYFYLLPSTFLPHCSAVV